MAEYQNPIDLCNRALQYLGAKRIDPALGFTEISVQASECAFAYGKLRRSELRANNWGFAIKEAVLRPLNALAVQGSSFLTSNTSAPSPTMRLSPPLWASTSTYPGGALVIDAASTIWQSLAPANTNFAPGNSSAWEEYAGPITVDAWLSGSSYFAGDLVYVAPGDGTYTVYQSLINGNSDTPGTATAFDATQVYAKDEVVTSASVIYQSLVDLNYGNTPASSPTQWTTTITSGTSATTWRVVPTELQQMVIMYPVGAGPAMQSATRNVFRLPSNWLREAPQDPKAGAISYLGVAGGLAFNDWTYSGEYLTSSQACPIFYRFVADITNVTKFDDMFCEALAARIAYAVCESVTQSTARQTACAQAYKKFMDDASMVNAIQQGWTDAPVDDLIMCRL